MTVLHDIEFFFWFPKGYVWKLIHSELSSLKIGTEFNKFSFLSMNSYGSLLIDHYVFSYCNAIEKELEFSISCLNKNFTVSNQF